MGGIIGRLFREFALTVTASIAISAVVSLTSDRCWRHGSCSGRPEHAVCFMHSKRCLTHCLAGYRRTSTLRSLQSATHR